MRRTAISLGLVWLTAFNLRVIPTNVAVYPNVKKYRSVYNGGKYHLDNWGVSLLRGEDRYNLSRKRQPEEVAYGVALGHERLSPSELLDQAREGEQAGFDAVCCSDHLAPWWDPDHGPPAHGGNSFRLFRAAFATRPISTGNVTTNGRHICAGRII